MDGKQIDRMVAATRAHLASSEGKSSWYDRRRAGLSDAQNWAFAFMATCPSESTGENVEAVVAAIQGRGSL